MSRNSLKKDLAHLAAEDRASHGQAPGVEQLIALRDGTLDDEQAQRVREYLALDPDMAQLYLSLREQNEPLAEQERSSDQELERGLNALVDRADGVESGGRLVSFPARWRGFLAMAATVLMAVTAWLLIPRAPDGPPLIVHVPSEPTETVRSGKAEEIMVPKDAPSVIFVIEATVPAAYGIDGPFELRLESGGGGEILSERGLRTPAKVSIERAFLRERDVYTLSLRTADGQKWEDVWTVQILAP